MGTVFCVDDTVELIDEPGLPGVIDRSFGDVDSHAPRPQKDYSDDIVCHHGVSRDDFDSFMRTGIPPRGTVLVSWQTRVKTELIPETKLKLLDRSLFVGDVVKRTVEDPMSGTVIGLNAVCTLIPELQYNHFIHGNVPPSAAAEQFIRQVPVEELIHVHQYPEGALVVYGDWIGRIAHVYDEVALKLSNNSVVVVEDPDDLDFMPDRLSVGAIVSTRKGNLRRGQWRYGAFDPNVRPEGIVVDTRTVYVDVNWLTLRLRDDNSDNSSLHSQEPASRLYIEELEDRLHIYDASPSVEMALPAKPGTDKKMYHVAQVIVGDRVRFKDLAGAAVKYDGSTMLPDGTPQGKFTRVPRAETLGYDMNVHLVALTNNQVTVMWQDLSVTTCPSTELVPDPNIEDDDEVWPGEIISTIAQQPTDAPWSMKPQKVGIVQAVKARDRIASVRWYESHDLQFVNDILLPPSSLGKLGEAIEDVSFYDISSRNSLTRRRGDFVLLHPAAVASFSLPPGHSGPNWFGEITDLGLDGLVTVRLGAAKPVVDVRVSYQHLTLAYSSDMDGDIDGDMDGDMVPFDEESVWDDDYDDDESDDDFDSASFNEMWIEYEGMDGVPGGEGNEDDWSTEEEDDIETDVSMPDAVPQSSITAEGDAARVQPESQQALQTTAASTQAEDSLPTSKDAGLPTDTESVATASHGPPSFLILDTSPPADHCYKDRVPSTSSNLMRRIAKEHKILRNSLPPNIFVRTWESRLDLIRVLLIGPSDTPYEFAPFIIDIHLGRGFPQEPPSAFFHSWTNGSGPVNPNLYEDGKICLSLLGTWHADERNESWSPTKSTLLQLFVSIMGLVLVKEPYYNEAGYDVHRQAPETKLSSALYTERTYFRTRAFIAHALSNEIAPFKEELRYFYVENSVGSPRLLDRAIEVAREVLSRSESSDEHEERDGLRRVSLGATVMLKRQVEALVKVKEKLEATSC